MQVRLTQCVDRSGGNGSTANAVWERTIAEIAYDHHTMRSFPRACGQFANLFLWNSKRQHIAPEGARLGSARGRASDNIERDDDLVAHAAGQDQQMPDPLAVTHHVVGRIKGHAGSSKTARRQPASRSHPPACSIARIRSASTGLLKK